MVLTATRCLLVAGALSGWMCAQNASRVAPVPQDPLELASGAIQTADSPASRAPALDLLSRAREHFALRSTRQGYDLKVRFNVNSGGVTEYDGAWQMEDIFDPKQGLHWTAKAAAGYTVTEISLNGKRYAEGTAGNFPLRLQEARSALFGAVPSAAYVQRGVIRTSTASLDGAPVVCVLFSAPENAGALPAGRGWDESEECIDPQSGLLKMYSQAPGRYLSYDYTNAPNLGGHILPRTVTVTESGHVVSRISVDSLEALASADPSLFAVTEDMKERGQPNLMADTQKIWRFAGAPSFSPDATLQPVCVFGLVTPAGDLVEAHSLQPSDPHSAAALEAARHMTFPAPLALGRARPPAQQHFEFVFVGFTSSRQASGL